MRQVQLNISLPDTAETTETELKMTFAVKLYENRRLSLGQAADAVGLTKRAFSELLGWYGVSLFSQTVEDLREDVANA